MPGTGRAQGLWAWMCPFTRVSLRNVCPAADVSVSSGLRSVVQSPGLGQGTQPTGSGPRPWRWPRELQTLVCQAEPAGRPSGSDVRLGTGCPWRGLAELMPRTLGFTGPELLGRAEPMRPRQLTAQGRQLVLTAPWGIGGPAQAVRRSWSILCSPDRGVVPGPGPAAHCHSAYVRVILTIYH